MPVKIAFLFSGQGAQYPGMMREAYEKLPGARHVFDTADRILKRSISSLCFEGSQEELNLTHNTQPCVLAADLAACAVAKSRGFEFCALAGFSLGEYAALVAAGCLSLEDAFRIIQLRADAMQDAVPLGEGAMAAVMNTDAAAVQELCDGVPGYVVPANYNSPTQIVVSGETAALDALLAACRKEKIRAVKLAVSAPFHCDMMASAADRIQEIMTNITLNEPSVPVYMNVDSLPLKSAVEIRKKLVEQVKSPVLWQQTLENMAHDGIRSFLECGPGSTLSGFVKKTLPEARIITLD